jgi:hypothetical protein
VTSDTSAVLAAIDSALTANGTVSRDWSSPDAMRWSPDKPELVICHGARPLMPERWSTWRAEAFHRSSGLRSGSNRNMQSQRKQ